MGRVIGTMSGLALGAWGAVQVLASGIAIALAGILRGTVGTMAAHGSFGPSFTGPAVGYDAVYHVEIYLLFATLIAIGPLVRRSSVTTTTTAIATNDLTQQGAALSLK
jgi:BCD family chlorophyll transporter-like MFS transporter